MMKQILQRDRLIVLFQNSEINPNGRIALTQLADLGMDQTSIVPVTITYDHLIEINELVGRDSNQISKVKLLKMLGEQRDGSLGRIYLTLGEAVAASAENVPRQIFTQQGIISPITLTSIVTALLNQTRCKQLDLDDLHKDVKLVYNYLDVRNHTKHVMNRLHSRKGLLKTVKSLGLKVKEIESQQGKRKRIDYTIEMEARPELFFYSGGLLQHLVTDTILAATIQRVSAHELSAAQTVITALQDEIVYENEEPGKIIGTILGFQDTKLTTTG